MKIDELLKKGEKAFHNMDWKEVAKINEEILSQKPDKRIKALATGFCHYALAKLGKGPEEVILNLDKARQSFKSADAGLASLAEIERLILLSEFDETNKGKHLKALGEFTQSRYTKTGDPSDLRLAIEAFENAKPYFEKEELAQINLNLTFCYGNFAPKSENPEEQYRKLLAICKELEKSYEGANLARVKMNAAIAYQNLAFLEESQSSKEDLKMAVRLNEEAIALFEQAASKPKIVRAKQSLANILRDAAQHDVDKATEYLKRVIKLRKEVAKLFLEGGYNLNYGYEIMDIGVACLELASVDKAYSKEHLEEAINQFEEVERVFLKEQKAEDLGQAKMGIAVAYKNLSHLKKAVKMYEDAVAIFEKEKSTLLLGRAKQNLAATYMDMAQQDKKGEKEYLAKAENLDKEAKKLLQKERVPIS
jgi:tetratricopeptide (TPR) repeat protein